MFTNYFKIAWRNLIKYRLISIINLFGLSIGLGSCLLITLYILNELSYDRFNKNADRIYRVTRDFYTSDGSRSLKLCSISPPFGYYMPTDFPEIEKMTRLLDDGITPLKYQDKVFNETNLFWADENLSDVFTFQMLTGNAKTALMDPFSVMMSEEAAKKYFGSEDPMNKTIRYNNKYDFKVTGIFKAFPRNSHLHPALFLSFNTLKNPDIYGSENLRTNWGNNSFFTYLLLPDKYNPQRMLNQFPAFIDRRMAGQEYVGQQASKFTKLGLQKLTDIHLYSHTDSEIEPNGDINRIYVFSAIAIFILLIACINYMNLATARSSLRAKEIGIRKVVGANKAGLIYQFLSESIILSFVAGIFAVVLCWASIPLLNKLSGSNIDFHQLLSFKILIPVFFTPFIIGFLSGIYPAVYMSSFQPVKTMKGLFSVGAGNLSIRKVLVISQFAISIILMIATLLVFQQLRFVQKKALGYDKDHLAIIPYPSDLNEKFESFRTELVSNSNIKNAGRSSRIPTGRLLDAMDAYVASGDTMSPSKVDIKLVAIDYDFIPTYGMTMISGRNFSREYSLDTTNFILNEAALRLLGWPDASKAIGNEFKYGNIKGHIIGIVKDFHFESMHQSILPLVLELFPARISFYHNLTVKLTGNDPQSTISYIESVWKRYLPEVPFQYNYLDQNFAALYQNEQRQGEIFTIFACIAIFIASLGLLGLSIFSITQRIREIGIRKVLGANLATLVTLLSKEFLFLVLIASLIATPIGWFGMHRWLNGFAYRIHIQWWVFVLAAGTSAIVALMTISFHAIKAAIANPTKSLRAE